MGVPDRAYDPARRPNTFYKGDPASNDELRSRARERGEFLQKPKNVAEEISESIGYGMANPGTPTAASGGKVGPRGSTLEGVAIIDPASETLIRGAEVSKVPISGTLLGKTKGMWKRV